MNVVILDTGCANLNSVKSAISRHGYDPVVSRDRTWCCAPTNCFCGRRHRAGGDGPDSRT